MAKVVLITGCSSGFGNITAGLLASKNFLIGLNAYLVYYVFKLVPYGLIDWFGKKAIVRISRWEPKIAIYLYLING